MKTPNLIDKSLAALREHEERALRPRLEAVDRLVNWGVFDRYLRWLDQEAGHDLGYPAMLLFKSMLIQQWFALSAVEFDYEMQDRKSFERFAGLKNDEAPPSHATVCSFRRLLIDRGVAQDIETALRTQLAALEQACMVTDQDAPDAASIGALPTLSARIEPDYWQRVKQQFMGWWESAAGDAGLPSLAAFVGFDWSELEGVEPFVIDIVGDGAFSWRDADISLNDEAARNVEEFGHPGLQEDLMRALRDAGSSGQPVAVTCWCNDEDDGRVRVYAIAAPANSGNAGPDAAADTIVGLCLIEAAHVAREDALAELRQLRAARNDGEAGHEISEMLAFTSGMLALDNGIRPDRWNVLEHEFLDYWRDAQRRAQQGEYPPLDLAGFPADFREHGFVVLPGDGVTDFAYRELGEHIIAQNGGDPRSSTIAQKQQRNESRFNHAGIQGEFLSILSEAIETGTPQQTASFFTNRKGEKRQIWAIAAPVYDEDDQPASVIGVALIQPVQMQ
jgi:IS5 family transposase